MKNKIVPIKSIIKKVKKYSKDQEKYKTELVLYSKLTKSQKNTISHISLDKLKNKLEESNLTLDEYIKYKDLLTEKKNYAKYDDIINNIINRDFDTINYKRILKRRKLIAGIGIITLLAIFSGVAYNKHNNKIPITTTQTTNNNTEYFKEESTEEIIHDEDDYSDDFEEGITEEETTEYVTNNNEDDYEEETTEYVSDNNEDNFEDDFDNETNNEDWGFEDLNTDNLNKLENFYNKGSEYIDIMEDTLTDSNKREEVKDKAKDKVIEYIDFIFYGSEINGVTFDELKDDQKEKIYEQLQKLDKTISEQDPDYKENYGERYNRIKDFSSTTLNKAKDKIKEKVGEDYYDNAGEIKDDTIDSLKETGNIIKKLIKKKYEDIRDKDN